MTKTTINETNEEMKLTDGEKEMSVKCIKSVKTEASEVFTKGKTYEAFSWYHDTEGHYNLSAVNNESQEHIISDGITDDMVEFAKDLWFKKHFEISSMD